MKQRYHETTIQSYLPNYQATKQRNHKSSIPPYYQTTKQLFPRLNISGNGGRVVGGGRHLQPYSRVRLEKMDLASLTFRRARGDAKETYKYLHGFYTIDSSLMLPLHTTDAVTTRGHKLYKKRLQDTASNELLWPAYGQQLEPTVRKNCTDRPPQSSASRDSMTGITSINVTLRIDTIIPVLDRSTGRTAYEGSNMMMMI